MISTGTENGDFECDLVPRSLMAVILSHFMILSEAYVVLGTKPTWPTWPKLYY